MSQQDTKSSGPTRAALLQIMLTDVTAMLAEKGAHYGEKGGFYENNSLVDYSHAAGEARLKLSEFLRRGSSLTPEGRRRLLVKALTWIYLIYETEVDYYDYGPK